MTIMGMLAADIDLLIESEELPDIFYRLRTLPAFFYRLKEFLPGKWIWHVLFLVGLYLAGCPRGIDDVDSVAANDPGWFFINWLTPRTRDGFVQCVLASAAERRHILTLHLGIGSSGHQHSYYSPFLAYHGCEPLSKHPSHSTSQNSRLVFTSSMGQ